MERAELQSHLWTLRGGEEVTVPPGRGGSPKPPQGLPLSRLGWLMGETQTREPKWLGASGRTCKGTSRLRPASSGLRRPSAEVLLGGGREGQQRGGHCAFWSRRQTVLHPGRSCQREGLFSPSQFWTDDHSHVPPWPSWASPSGVGQSKVALLKKHPCLGPDLAAFPGLAHANHTCCSSSTLPTGSLGPLALWVTTRGPGGHWGCHTSLKTGIQCTLRAALGAGGPPPPTPAPRQAEALGPGSASTLIWLPRHSSCTPQRRGAFFLLPTWEFPTSAPGHPGPVLGSAGRSPGLDELLSSLRRGRDLLFSLKAALSSLQNAVDSRRLV